MTTWSNHSGPTLVVTHLNCVTTPLEERISGQLLSGCVREFLPSQWDLGYVTTVGRSLQEYLQQFHLTLTQKVTSTLTSLNH